jgi:hypothetical protein
MSFLTSFTFVWGSEGCSLHLVADDPTYINAFPLPDKVSFHAGAVLGSNPEEGPNPNYSATLGDELHLLSFAAKNELMVSGLEDLLEKFEDMVDDSAMGLSILKSLGYEGKY